MVAAAVFSCTVTVSVQISKFLSQVLRHDPGRVGIALDDAGWIDVATLLAACAAHGVPISRDGLAAIVASSDKQRFAFSPDGTRIRANQGHSIEVDLQLPPARPGAWRSPIEPARRGKGPGQLRRIAIAEQTLAAVDAGRYVNARNQIVGLQPAVEAAVSGSVLHELGEPLRAPARLEASDVAVTGESTIEALIRIAARPGGHLACLSFASALHPGGSFLAGAQAQEESLARSSALYPCLLRQPSHYARNRSHHSAYYLDLAVFSPHVPVFRDDDGGWLDRPLLASIVTCAAPNVSALREQGKLDAATVEATLRRRAAFVLAIAAHHGVARLVLGAWGAGVFDNDPAMVADAFGALLEGPFTNIFAEVVFAIAGGSGQPNHDVFAERFARTQSPISSAE